MDKPGGTPYDCAIIGGGIGGLCLAIQLADMGYKVIVLEKHNYPFHKVCGEFVSNESRCFFLRLGLNLNDWNLPSIDTLGISSEKGYFLEARLPLGGFGISRHKLDFELSLLARNKGVEIREGFKATAINGNTVSGSGGEVEARIVVGAFGKSSPVFAKGDEPKLQHNYIGVKYHIRTSFPSNRIELHNFHQGYCGISRIEDGQYSLCYLSHSSNLSGPAKSIPQMEEQILMRNPFLKRIFSESDFLFKQPVTVSNIRFSARKTSDNKLLYLGDAAGAISPLTGNGMSMAAQGSMLLAGQIDRFLRNEQNGSQLRENYNREWNKRFASRIIRGRKLQYLFGKRQLSDLTLRILDPMGPLKSAIIRSTQGRPF